MIDLLKVKDMKEEEYSLYRILKEIECPEKYQDIIRDILTNG